MQPTILLSFDVEEFDMPFEYNGSLPFDEQIAISTTGLQKLLLILNTYKICVTFYCTATYALAKKEVIEQLHRLGHEVASHAYYHSAFNSKDLKRSKDVLENIINHPVKGFRMPRMMPVDTKALHAAGYFYNSSLNPTWLPGRYNHFKAPRTYFKADGVWQVPASVSPLLRVPLFWLSFHNLPYPLYWGLCKRTMHNDGYVHLYFHPWEFEDYRHAGNAKFPGYVTRNCGEALLQRTERLIKDCLQKNYTFSTTIKWLENETGIAT